MVHENKLEQKHFATFLPVVLDVLWQSEVVQLRLPGVGGGLDEYLPHPDVLADLGESVFHGLPRPEDGYPADAADAAPPAAVVHPLRRLHLHVLEGKEGERVLDHQSDEAARVKDEFVSLRLTVADEGVEAADLRGGGEDAQGVREGLVGVAVVGEVLADSGEGRRKSMICNTALKILGAPLS